MDSLIPIVNQLQEVISLSKVSVGIDLPQVIVVGSQSSGKSSVLESIVGKDFLPRGVGIVTRCPLFLRLIKTNEDMDYATFNHITDCIFTDFADVTNEITTRSKEIAITEGVSTTEIILNIYSSQVVDLTLIDLPGIIKVPLQGQDRNLDKKINAMIMDYAKRQNSIILAISPANSDLANSDALNIARQADPEGNRTIGVITKIDLMDRGTNALDMIEGKLYNLKLGYVGVVCRSQEDIINGLPMNDHLQRENQFFEESKVYSHLSQRLGIKYLSQRLSQIFKLHIQATIPKIKREISCMLEKVNKELLEMGDHLDTKEKKNDLLYRLINSFCKKFEDSLDGKDIDKCMNQLLGGSMIRALFRNFFADIIGRIDPLENLTDYQIRIAILNATGAKGVMFVSEIAFENLVTEIIKRLKEPSIKCLIDTKDELQKIIFGIEIPEFKRFTKLKDLCLALSHEVIDSCIEVAENNICDIIEVESSFLNISHPDFINPHKAMEEAKNELESVKMPKIEKNGGNEGKGKDGGMLSSIWPFSSNKQGNEMKYEEMGAEMKKVDNMLDDEMSPAELLQVVLIRILIKSYFNIAKLNIGDSIPKSIMRNLVNQTRDSLQRILTNRIYNNQEIYDSFLDEDLPIKNKRNACNELRDCLNKAYEILREVVA